MVHSHSTFRTVIALILLGALALVCLSLGRWQLSRAAERDAINQAIQAGQNAPPLTLLATTAVSELTPWRPARASGTWLHDFTVLLENRNYKGRPGLWVATPLLLDGTPRTALLVLRGWLPRPLGPDAQLPDLAPAPGPQRVQGQLLGHVPRLFELWSLSGRSATQLPARLPATGSAPTMVQNLALYDYARATGLHLLPIVLQQTQEADAAVLPSAGAATGSAANASTGATQAAHPPPVKSVPLVRDWPLPSLDSDKNRGYALQWFGFATIAAVAWFMVIFHSLRRRARAARAAASD